MRGFILPGFRIRSSPLDLLRFLFVRFTAISYTTTKAALEGRGFKPSFSVKAPNIICPQLDLTVPETIKLAIDETLDEFGRIDVLVNNAGYALMGPMEAVTPEQLHHQFQINVFGLVSTMQAVIPLFREQRQGTIINVASIGGRIGFPMTASYHGTKWAVEGISEAMRYELQPFGIRVKIIEPGGIKTNFINRGAMWAIHPEYSQMIQQVKEFMYKIDNMLPEPDGVAKAIYQAATDGSDRLRYSPHGEAFLLLHALLPDRVWRSLVKRIMLGKSSRAA
ncbi:SDR family oxidoreductase [Anabaena azotica]|uniref:SDR family oxidoreductase n=1 Tax=Anabaena azotica FACHB-119 TaxID=947527 RepID=A0ABR8CYC6_9NOST|nr:SDR family oxidoreductase [Anabaena azotica]MBD2499920.1 SDR family oxidoreductase [Anabaena azotica FACHB-119]